ncbi:Glutathione transferase fosA [Kluyvera cryocrescens]|uniref:Glutathione transferase fosA n=1 Tax=Kluyvera cryocrescens TaxID=580 RepID=A0A485CEC0_KLUCR|nr:Glutathione transferase fosA [Kluyvera cryocrescens]
MLSGLNHLTLAVSDLPASVAFYQQLPGMRLHARWDGGAYLSCGALWLCLSLDAQRRITAPEESDYTHYAFSVAAEQFAEVCAKLAENGSWCGRRIAAKGSRTIFSTRTAISSNCTSAASLSGWPPAGSGPMPGMVFYDA